MKRQLGISIYPDHSSNDEDKAYLELAQRYGFSRIFMSMLEVTEGKEIVRKKFTELPNHLATKRFWMLHRQFLKSWKFLMMI